MRGFDRKTFPRVQNREKRCKVEEVEKKKGRMEKFSLTCFRKNGVLEDIVGNIFQKKFMIKFTNHQI